METNKSYVAKLNFAFKHVVDGMCLDDKCFECCFLEEVNFGNGEFLMKKREECHFIGLLIDLSTFYGLFMNF